MSFKWLYISKKCQKVAFFRFFFLHNSPQQSNQVDLERREMSIIYAIKGLKHVLGTFSDVK